MSPQFVDFNADGTTDIVTATFEGVAFLVPGSASGFQKQQKILDQNGRDVRLVQYYDFENNSWENTDADHCVSTTAFDWDADGDLDLLLGAYEGQLYLQKNEGTPKEPKFTGVNEKVMTQEGPLEIEGGLTAARLVDWNQDGLTDLVCGGFEGGAWLFLNRGTVSAPSFQPGQVLIPKANNDDATKTRHPNKGVYADPVDYDGDGDLDLLVGGYITWEVQPPTLSESQESRLAELTEQLREVHQRMGELAEPIDREGLTAEERGDLIEELQQNEEYQSLVARMQELSAEQRPLMPRTESEAGIWLYRQKDEKPVGE